MAIVMDGSVHLPVGPERARDLWVDAARYPQWQAALLAVRELSGALDAAGATCVLDHGPKLARRVRVTVAERPGRHVIEQTGISVQDLTTATFTPEGEGTRLTVVTHMHLNPLMHVLARFDRRPYQARVPGRARSIRRARDQAAARSSCRRRLRLCDGRGAAPCHRRRRTRRSGPHSRPPRPPTAR